VIEHDFHPAEKPNKSKPENEYEYRFAE
jgi:hypothetical protein